MALAQIVDLARVWLQNRFRFSANATAIHDGIEAAFAEVDTDRETAESRTILGEADDEGLRLWGLDFGEKRQPNQSTEQYRGALEAIEQGNEVTLTGCAFALSKYGITARLISRNSPDCFAGLAYAGVSAMVVGKPTELAVLYDPWDSGAIPDVDDFNQRCINSANDLFNITAAGVKVNPFFPPTITP